MSFDSKGYLLTPDDGPQLWFLDTRMNIKAGGAQTGGAFTLIEWSAPAGFGPPLHVHGLDDEGFYILDGEISIECGDKHFTAGPGDFTFLPRGLSAWIPVLARVYGVWPRIRLMPRADSSDFARNPAAGLSATSSV